MSGDGLEGSERSPKSAARLDPMAQAPSSTTVLEDRSREFVHQFQHAQPLDGRKPHRHVELEPRHPQGLAAHRGHRGHARVSPGAERARRARAVGQVPRALRSRGGRATVARPRPHHRRPGLPAHVDGPRVRSALADEPSGCEHLARERSSRSGRAVARVLPDVERNLRRPRGRHDDGPAGRRLDERRRHRDRREQEEPRLRPHGRRRGRRPRAVQDGRPRGHDRVLRQRPRDHHRPRAGLRERPRTGRRHLDLRRRSREDRARGPIVLRRLPRWGDRDRGQLRAQRHHHRGERGRLAPGRPGPHRHVRSGRHRALRCGHPSGRLRRRRGRTDRDHLVQRHVGPRERPSPRRGPRSLSATRGTSIDGSGTSRACRSSTRATSTSGA